MTIPSRPAPPPPQQQSLQQQQYGSTAAFAIKLPPPPSGVGARTNGGTSFRYSKTSSSVTRNFPAAKTRYAPITNWDGASFDVTQMNNINGAKKPPPPRPPPPKLPPNMTGNTVLKKPGPPQSVNVLSNLFGRKKSHTTKKHHQQQQHNSLPKISTFPLNNSNIISTTTTTTLPNNQILRPSSVPVTEQRTTDFQLISFDSPPSSPTLTQKSNSDCVSVDSFSSDSNFSSPNNGSVSQPESGFEDDFISPLDDPWDSFTNNIRNLNNNELKITQPVRNINAIHRNQNDNPLCNGKSLLPPQETLAMPTIIRPKTSQNCINVSPVHHSVFNTTTTTTQYSQSTSIFKNNDAQEPYEYTTTASLDTVYPSLPMPNCPPPPPPANILDVVNGQLDALELYNENSDAIQPYGIALYDFEGTQDGDLSFKENEKVYLIQRLNEEWFLGRNKRGCEGMFPSTYVEIKVPLDSNEMNNISTSSNNSCNTYTSHHTVKALYDFKAEASEDLSLKENDLVTVLYRINEDWLYGVIDNRKGQFPANFLEYIPENLSQK